MADQRAISSRVRAQPRHQPLSGSILQTSVQGEVTACTTSATGAPVSPASCCGLSWKMPFGWPAAAQSVS